MYICIYCRIIPSWVWILIQLAHSHSTCNWKIMLQNDRLCKYRHVGIKIKRYFNSTMEINKIFFVIMYIELYINPFVIFLALLTLITKIIPSEKCRVELTSQHQFLSQKLSCWVTLDIFKLPKVKLTKKKENNWKIVWSAKVLTR